MAATSTAFINEVLRLTNQYRAKEGLKPLTLNEELNKTAQDHSQDMAQKDFFSHTGLNGSKPWDRAEDNGYTARSMAENIAAGQRSPESVVKGWMNSSGHRKNILNPNYTELGVGYYNLSNDTGSVNYQTYWTQVFGSGDLTPSRTIPTPVKPPSNPAPSAPVRPQPTPVAGAAPVAYFNFNEGRGVIAKDASSKGAQHTARLAGGAQWTNSKSRSAGKAVSLDGQNDKVLLKNSSALNASTRNDHTVSMWFKIDNAGRQRKQVVYERGGLRRGVNAYVKDNLLHFGQWNTSEGRSAKSWKKTRISSNKWHHMALVVDNQPGATKDSLTAYINGRQVGKIQATEIHGGGVIGLGNVRGSTRFHDGARSSGQGYGLDGAIDELKVFNNALSAAQVNKLADFM